MGDFLRTGEVDNGYHLISGMGSDRDLTLALFNQYRGHKTTVVFFDSALRNGQSLPSLQGMPPSRSLEINRLFISDPSLLGYEDLDCGWYLGNHEQRLQAILEDIISHVFESQRDAAQLVFYGAFSGGFASLYFSSKFENSISLVANPHTNLARLEDQRVKEMSRICFEGLKQGDEPRFPHSIVTDLTEVYSRPIRNTVLYIQNSDDPAQLDTQLSPFLTKLHFANDTRLLLGKWGTKSPNSLNDVLRKSLRNVVYDDWSSRIYDIGFVRQWAEPLTPHMR